MNPLFIYHFGLYPPLPKILIELQSNQYRSNADLFSGIPICALTQDVSEYCPINKTDFAA